MEKQIGEFSHVHVTEKKKKRKVEFSVPMSIKKTFEMYDDCLFLIMLVCPNEKFIKYIVGFSCILVFFFMNLHCIMCLFLQARNISHPTLASSFPAHTCIELLDKYVVSPYNNDTYHPMSMNINSKLRNIGAI